MRVTEITLANVMRHNATKLAFPERGIVCVTGANGAGKSSIIEAVSVAVWGQTLRKTPVWRRTGKGAITAILDVGRDTVLLSRTRSKSKELLEFSSLHGGQQTFDNKTKAQEALAAIVGSHARWRRTHAFSSQDASHFTLATDAERKRLLEDILGLERFDVAHASAARDRRALEKVVASAESTCTLLKERVRHTKQRLDDSLEVMRSIPASLPTTVPDLEKVEKRIASLTEKIKGYDASIDLKSHEIYRMTEQVDRAQGQLEYSEKLDFCDECGSELDETHEARLKARAERVERELRPQIDEAVKMLEKLKQSRTQAMKERGDQIALKATTQSAVKAAKERASERREAEERVTFLREGLEDANDALDVAQAELDTQRKDLAALSAAERVLSLSGVRSYLLGQALAGIEEIANGWLARLVSSELSLSLKPYSEKASGGIKDSISMEIEGAGEGYGYAATSGGERRRIDIALLLALGEVAEAAAGISTGTMFFDEVFDALDDDGVSTATEVLQELAKDRCVVVISHNQSLVGRLQWSRRWIVSDGQVTEKIA